MTSWSLGPFIAIKQDISARKQAEDALRKAHGELEMRVQARTAELKAMSFKRRWTCVEANGMGMGPAISQAIMEAHEGRLEAVNNPEGGATFQATLPVHHSYVLEDQDSDRVHHRPRRHSFEYAGHERRGGGFPHQTLPGPRHSCRHPGSDEERCRNSGCRCLRAIERAVSKPRSLSALPY